MKVNDELQLNPTLSLTVTIGHKVNLSQLYRNCSSVVYVIDAQEDDFMDALPRLADTIKNMYDIHPKIFFEVFLHKVDGDIMSEEIKSERQQVTIPICCFLTLLMLPLYRTFSISSQLSLLRFKVKYKSATISLRYTITVHWKHSAR